MVASYSASYSDQAQSSQQVSGNVFGGVNFGANADRAANLPAFLANRGTPNAPIELVKDLTLDKVLLYGGGLVLFAVLYRSVKNGK